jgi:hypothetical protein
LRIQWGDPPKIDPPPAVPSDLHAITGPAPTKAFRLAALVGIALLAVFCIALATWASYASEKGRMAIASDAAFAWLAPAIVLVTFIPFHELIHLLGHPGWGLTHDSVLTVWPAKLRFGVYYEGCMSRRRWLIMRFAPFFVLCLFPALIVALMQMFSSSPDLEIGLIVMMVVNALGSGGDIVAAAIVLR